MQTTPLSPSKKVAKKTAKKKHFAVQYRFLIGWTTILMVIGGYGAYLFALKSPHQQQRLSTLEKNRKKQTNLTSLIHQDNLSHQEGYFTKQSQGKSKQQQIAQLKSDKKKTSFDPVFQTTVQSAPTEKEVLQETANAFSSVEAKILEDQGPIRTNVAFKPIESVEDIETNYQDDDEIVGETVADKEYTKTEKPQFAIQLITSRSLYVIEEKWYELKEIDQENILDELQPKFTVTDVSLGKKDYTLLAGPFPKVSEAIAVCKDLLTITNSCSESLYRGQDLFQSGSEEQFPVGSINDKAPEIR